MVQFWTMFKQIMESNKNFLKCTFDLFNVCPPLLHCCAGLSSLTGWSWQGFLSHSHTYTVHLYSSLSCRFWLVVFSYNSKFEMINLIQLSDSTFFYLLKLLWPSSSTIKETTILWWTCWYQKKYYNSRHSK